MPLALWQDLVSDQGFTGSYQTVKRFSVSSEDRNFQKLPASSSPRQEKKRRSITAVGRWCVIRRAASIAARACSC